jgi:hypothetical protein
MFRSLIVLLVLPMLLLGLAGCGGDDAKTPKITGGTKNTEGVAAGSKGKPSPE